MYLTKLNPQWQLFIRINVFIFRFLWQGFQITLFGRCALVILSLRIIQVFILFMTLKSVNIHTKNQIPDIQHRHKKGVKRNYLVVLCSRHHKYFNGISFYHENTRRSFIEFNHPVAVCWPFHHPHVPVSKNSSECGTISTCIFGFGGSSIITIFIF